MARLHCQIAYQCLMAGALTVTNPEDALPARPEDQVAEDIGAILLLRTDNFGNTWNVVGEFPRQPSGEFSRYPVFFADLQELANNV